MSKDTDREKRLAAALRANLRRRKAQARGAAETMRKGDESPATRHIGEGRNPD